MDLEEGSWILLSDHLVQTINTPTNRVCAGRYMADNTVWLTIASVLATLDLRKPKDKQGNDISISEDYTSGFFR